MQSKLSACGGSRKRHLPRRRSAILSGAFFIRIGRIFLSNKIKMGYHTSMAAHLLMYVLFILFSKMTLKEALLLRTLLKTATSTFYVLDVDTA